MSEDYDTQAPGHQDDGGPSEPVSAPPVAEPAPDTAGAADPAPAVLFGYLPGFTDGVRAGYSEGRRDVSEAKSEAAAAGYRRGLAAAEVFPPRAPVEADDGLRLTLYLIGGLLLGVFLERRRAAAEQAREEVAGDDVPELR